MNDSLRYSCIPGFGEELDEIIYSGISNWFISFRSLSTIYKAHYSYLVVFITILGCGILSYRHSTENGKKHTQFWWGALLHGVFQEKNFTATKYWHAQAPIMFFGKQLPLHIVLFYPSVIYISTVAIQKLRLNKCVEPAAIGLLVMSMEIPFRMISVKFLHITYHDTEPMYLHKFCGIPWIEIFSSLIFSSSFIAVYHAAHYYNSKDLSSLWDESDPNQTDTLITILSTLGSQIIGFLQKLLLLYFFHDFFNVNPISCWFLTVALYISFIISFESKKTRKSVGIEESTAKTYLFYQVFLYFSCLIYLALFGKPQNEISIGLHEPTGDCTTIICSRTPLGKPLRRKKYLCADEVAARKNFLYTFECLEEGPPCLNAIWYTICGSKLYNKAQFFLNILSFIILMSSIYCKILFADLKLRECLQGLKNIFKSECSETPPSSSLPFDTQGSPHLSSEERNPSEPSEQEQKDQKEQDQKDSSEKAVQTVIPEEVRVGFVFLQQNNPLVTFQIGGFKKNNNRK